MLEQFLNTLRYYGTIIDMAKLTDKELDNLNITRADVIQVAFKQYRKDNGLTSRAFR